MLTARGVSTAVAATIGRTTQVMLLMAAAFLLLLAFLRISHTYSRVGLSAHEICAYENIKHIS